MIFRGYNFLTNEPLIEIDQSEINNVYQNINDSTSSNFLKRIVNCRKLSPNSRRSCAHRALTLNSKLQKEILDEKTFLTNSQKSFLNLQIIKAQIINIFYSR